MSHDYKVIISWRTDTSPPWISCRQQMSVNTLEFYKIGVVELYKYTLLSARGIDARIGYIPGGLCDGGWGVWYFATGEKYIPISNVVSSHPWWSPVGCAAGVVGYPKPRHMRPCLSPSCYITAPGRFPERTRQQISGVPSAGSRTFTAF